MNERRQQVVKQLEAVVHLATALANVSSDLLKLYADPACKVDSLVEQVGNRTAFQMELLGDMLNGMDAVDADEDAKFDSVFETAHKMWPQHLRGEAV